MSLKTDELGIPSSSRIVVRLLVTPGCAPASTTAMVGGARAAINRCAEDPQVLVPHLVEEAHGRRHGRQQKARYVDGLSGSTKMHTPARADCSAA